MNTNEKTVRHTAGPWMVYREAAIDYRPCQIFSQKYESQIALLCGGGPDKAICGPEERANARLIASAPELLEALKAVCKIEGRNPIPTNDEIEAFKQARSAIARATGETI